MSHLTPPKHSQIILALLLACIPPSLFAQKPAPAPPPRSTPASGHASQLDHIGTPPVHLTADKDRLRLLGLLGLKPSDLRPAPSPDANAPNSANYDEAKASVYPNLPDALVFKNGKPVKTRADWTRRAAEIRADYDREILGQTPRQLPAGQWQVISTKHEKYGGVDVITKRLAGHVAASGEGSGFTIDLLLTTPAHAAGPVPVIMELAFNPDFQNAISGPLDNFTPGHWGIDGKPVVQRGWGFAILNPVSFQADDGSGLTSGVIGWANHGKPRSLDDWGVLKAWAWGAGQALHYFETDKAVDARQVGLAGHSRMGKAVLVAMAWNPRFAIGYSSSSGEGGAKLYRHIYGETIPNLASASLYHWFNGNFLRYASKLNAGDLPVDNHELIALCAPRPIYIAAGSNDGDGYTNPNGDAWADPRGMFLAEVAAGPVYKLLGAKDLGTSQFPPIETNLAGGDLAFRQHLGGHLMGPDWPYFLDFAARYLHRPSRPGSKSGQ